MSDNSTDQSSYKTQSSSSIFFSDIGLINCLSKFNNQFNFQDLSNLSYNNNFAIPPTFPEDKCHPSFSPMDVQKMNPAIRVCLESSSGTSGINQKLGRGKRKSGEGDQHSGKEVAHVRAKRGQATDRHSLAERVRRGKINERLRCLQGIVPGCYKTMGMAVMLDEIINYVQSLQNQVEFLSMKLAAASSNYDFNSEVDAVESTQRAQAFGKQSDHQMQSLMRSHPQSSSSPTCDT